MCWKHTQKINATILNEHPTLTLKTETPLRGMSSIYLYGTKTY